MKASITLVALIVTLVIGWLFIFPQKPPQNTDSVSNTQAVTVLRFGHNTPENSALHEAALKFAEAVQKKTHNKVRVEIYPAQQLGNDHEMVEMARSGELDLLLTPTAKMSVPVPSMQYADLPFYFPSREDVYNMLDGEPGKMLFEDLGKIGLIGLGFWENGFKHFTGNTPLLTPSDFEKKKIRVMKSRIIMEQFRSLGAEPIPIDFHSTRQALLDQVVDGQENPLIAIVSMGFHEVQTDLILSEHAFLGYVFSISEKSLLALSQDTQIAIFEAAKEVTPWERAETQRREAELLKTIEASGTNIHTLTAEQKRAFSQRMSYLVKEYEEVIGPHIISKTNELLLDKYGSSAESNEQIVIGINADLSRARTAGLSIKRGVQLAVDEINESGGLLGKPVQVIARDHRLISSVGQENMRYFSEREDVVAVIGGKHSAIVASEIELVQKLKIPYLIPWAASAAIIDNGFEDNYLFRISANDRLSCRFIANQAVKKAKKVAIVVENTIWGRGNLEGMREVLGLNDSILVHEKVFNLGQDSYKTEVASIINSGAEVIVLVANSNEGARFIQELSVQRPEIPVISHWGIIGGRLWEDHREAVKKLDLSFFQTFSFRHAKTEQARKLKGRYLQAYNLDSADDIQAPNGVAQAYDLVQLLALAIKQANSLERSTVKEALENLPGYTGVIKRYSNAFNTQRHDALDASDFIMARFNDQGQIVPIAE